MQKISILLSTYNGAKHLKEQLDSLYAQTCGDIEIIVRDDGSCDATCEILKSYDVKAIKEKENLGAKGSFAELLEYAVSSSNSEYFMFCDQDDVWEKDKIEKTLAKMQEMEKKFWDIPLLVHTDLEVVDKELNTINSSFMDFQKIDYVKSSFHNLLMQNTITGCTMMINRKLATKCLPIPDGAIMHDWWIGLVASKFGKVGYIDEPTIKYRQHGSNTVGAKGFNFSFIFTSVFKKIDLNQNISQANIFLEIFKNELDEKTIQMLEDFSTIKSKSFWQKRKILLKHKLLKQGIIRNMGLMVKI